MKKPSINIVKRVTSKIDPKMTKIFLPWILKHPKSVQTMSRLARAYKKSRRIRNEELLVNNLKVPPFLIISITSSCNLSCSGCYAAATGTLCKSNRKNQLSLEQWRKVIQEGRELGVFGFIIAGGEPFAYPNLLDLCEEFSDRLFVIFTNGTLLNENVIKRLNQSKNIAVVVSIEGDEHLTDLRRGNGVYQKVIETITNLDKKGIVSGISVTINRNNLNYWMVEKNIDDLISKGIRIGFLLEYIPVDGDSELMLTKEESQDFRKQVLYYRENKQIFLIHSPGDEEYMGGCVSAGRGFAHVTPSGDLTPCPVSNIATHNLTRSSLREGLASQLFKVIRENEHLLETEGSPCALFAHPVEMEALTIQVKAYKTKV